MPKKIKNRKPNGVRIDVDAVSICQHYAIDAKTTWEEIANMAIWDYIENNNIPIPKKKKTKNASVL